MIVEDPQTCLFALKPSSQLTTTLTDFFENCRSPSMILALFSRIYGLGVKSEEEAEGY